MFRGILVVMALFAMLGPSLSQAGEAPRRGDLKKEFNNRARGTNIRDGGYAGRLKTDFNKAARPPDDNGGGGGRNGAAAPPSGPSP